jgi:hypothetical protein
MPEFCCFVFFLTITKSIYKPSVNSVLGDLMKLKMSIILVVVSMAVLLTFGCTNNTLGDDTNPDDIIIGGQLDEHGCLPSAGYSFDENIGACSRPWELDEETKQIAKIAVAEFESDNTPVIISVDSSDCDQCYIVEISSKSSDQSEIKSIKIQENEVVEEFTFNGGETPNEKDYEIDFSYDSNQQKVFYSILLDAPRACDSFEVIDTLFLESYPVQVVIKLRLVEADMMCAQVMTPVTIEGEFELNHEPGSITVVLEDNSFSEPENPVQEEDKVYCTSEQKQAEMCYLIYAPVCGDNGITYGNDCQACASGEIEYYTNGEC